MHRPTGRFSRSDRVRESRDYRRISRSGSRSASKNFVVLAAPTRDLATGERPGGGQRLGVTVSRRVGNAVTRNRVKRRIREWFRKVRSELATDTEIVVIARREAAEIDWRSMTTDLTQLVERANRAAETRRSSRTTRFA
jgi:ribonuclease P protein component